MARLAFTAAAALLLLACAAEASRMMVDADLAPSGRDLLQTAANCSVIANCQTCRNQRNPRTKISEVVCSTCKTNFRLKRDGISKTCEAAPGFYGSSATPCDGTKYCPGGTDTAVSCPTGLETTVANAKSIAQCNTLAGYGRVSVRAANGSVSVEGRQCDQGYYNVGKNQAACQKCGAGLTTAGTGSTNSSSCIAPAGSFKDRGAAKLCPKATYSNGGTDTCTGCPEGLTTNATGTIGSSAAVCTDVQKGFYKSGSTAVQCAIHTYNDVEGAVDACKQCTSLGVTGATYLKTQTTGATGAAECLFPPGVDKLGPCRDGMYKEGWNLDDCVSCGSGGFVTYNADDGTATGSVSKAACMVPAGMGLTSATGAAWTIGTCPANTYGAAEARPAVNNVRCQSCPPNTYSIAGQAGELSCTVAAGWGLNNGGVEKCTFGTFNAGGNRLACQECPAGTTTEQDGQSSNTSCVAKAGWAILSGATAPTPCDKGEYSALGATICQQCSGGYTTQEAESTSEADCNVCKPGYGGDSCAQCPVNSFSAGGQANGTACTGCATGTVSRRRATENTMCLDELQSFSADVLSLGGTGAAWVDQGAINEATCQANCKNSDTCIMYRFTDAATDTCEFLVEDAGNTLAKLGLKVGSGADYVIRAFPDTATAGVMIGSAAAVADQDTCQTNCNADPTCEAFKYVDSSKLCTLSKSENVMGATSMFHPHVRRAHRDATARGRAGPARGAAPSPVALRLAAISPARGWGATLALLSGCPLRELELVFADVCDADLAGVAQLAALTRLDLHCSRWHLTPACVPHLARLAQLRELQLAHARLQLGPAELECLGAACSQLTQLHAELSLAGAAGPGGPEPRAAALDTGLLELLQALPADAGRAAVPPPVPGAWPPLVHEGVTNSCSVANLARLLAGARGLERLELEGLGPNGSAVADRGGNGGGARAAAQLRQMEPVGCCLDGGGGGEAALLALAAAVPRLEALSVRGCAGVGPALHAATGGHSCCDGCTANVRRRWAVRRSDVLVLKSATPPAMARLAFTAAAALLLLACAAEASRMMVDADLAPSGRDLLQTAANCSVIANCQTCRNQRNPRTKISEVVCSTCKTNFRLKRDGISKTCEAAPGFYGSSATPCDGTKYCPGGTDTAVSCPTGLETTVANAKSIAQCNTLAGYGRVSVRAANGSVSVEGRQCDQGYYNVGKNQAACQKCGAGLTTAGTGSTNSSSCIAPAGSFKDRGAAKLCPKATYSNGGTDTCTGCPEGLTTNATGTIGSSAAVCTDVQKGFYKSGSTAVQCAIHTYNDVEGAVDACKQCTSLGLGPCRDGMYKEGWNLDDCVSCGSGGFVTYNADDGTATGSVSKAACMVPAGMGLTSATGAAWTIGTCPANTYGAAEARPAVNNVRCQSCPPNTYSIAGQAGELSCTVAAGWGLNNGGVEKCTFGTFNAGGNRLACQECPAGTTTEQDGQSSNTSCVAKAGWAILSGATAPTPCDKGEYSALGATICQQCSGGYTTQEAESTSEADCNVCKPGYGGDSCAQCPVNSFSAGGQANGTACTGCATGTVSRRRATENTMCLDELQSFSADVLSLGGTGAAWVDQGAINEATCQANCKNSDTCIMYRFTDAATDTCEFLVEDAGNTLAKLGLKVGSGADYVIRAFPDTATAGVMIGSAAAVADQDTCQTNCNADPTCEAFKYVDSSKLCTLSKSENVMGATSMFHPHVRRAHRDATARGRAGPARGAAPSPVALRLAAISPARGWGATLALLSGCPLRELELVFADVCDADLAGVAQLAALTRLDLHCSRWHLTPACVPHLARLAQLRELQLAHARLQLGPAELECLGAACSQLTQLHAELSLAGAAGPGGPEPRAAALDTGLLELLQALPADAGRAAVPPPVPGAWPPLVHEGVTNSCSVANLARLLAGARGLERLELEGLGPNGSAVADHLLALLRGLAGCCSVGATAAAPEQQRSCAKWSRPPAMARLAFTAAAALLLLACAAEASRMMVDADLAPSGRDLLQTAANCSVIANCQTCRNQRNPRTKISEVVCSTCKTNFRLKRDGISKTCEAAPGFYGSSATPCDGTKYCPGGTDTAVSCPTGLETTVANAKSIAQCNTLAGYGRVSVRAANGSVSVEGRQCDQGYYNVGKNQAACQKCGAGLTTAGTGSTNSSSCIAPAGSFKDRGAAKLCPKATYSNGGTDTCTGCPEGLTTNATGTIGSSAAVCTDVQKGFYKSGSTAVQCAIHTYNDVEGAVDACKQCTSLGVTGATYLKTQTTGATGAAECLFPPGVDKLGPCRDGMYKEGWNLDDCVSCGSGGFVTYNADDGTATGSVSKAACMVPAGMGLTSATGAAWTIGTCPANTYGAAEARPAVNNVRCQSCPPNTYSIAGQAGELSCTVAAGWGLNNGGVEKCTFGTFNAGGNRLACQECPAGTTTEQDGQSSNTSCVAKAGWAILSGATAPTPCDKGEYSALGATICQQCSGGYTTQEAESTSEADCNVCKPGYGGDSCAQCPVNSFSAGGQANGTACTGCATGTVSRRRATENTMCLDELQSFSADVLSLGGTGAAWVDQGAINEATCQANCKNSDTCIMYRFTDAATDTCEFLVEDAGNTLAKLGLKVGSGADYVIRAFPDTATAGVMIGSAAAVADQDTCQTNCNADPTCEAFKYVDSSKLCTLSKSENVMGATSMFHVVGSKLASDIALGA
ncbi:hypothetical protein HT031_005104 [Scenedesmus sp. PABB004]|nr:hypothetical protein HT031_005104 [Scenedesmus sp. PABB004]